MPRHTSLTPELIDRIAAKVLEGATFRDACELSGVREATGREWLCRGLGTDDRSAEPIYVQFADAVRQAELEAKHAAIVLIQTAAKGRVFEKTKISTDSQGTVTEEVTTEVKASWQAAAWYLARRYPHEWGSKRMDVLEALHTLAEANWIPQSIVETASNEMGNVRSRIQEGFTHLTS